MPQGKFELGTAENSFLQQLMRELPPEDAARLTIKAAEGLLTSELEKVRASHQFGISSEDIDSFIQNVGRMERAHRGAIMTSYDMQGTFKTASGQTQITSKKGCYIATAVYGDFGHPNVLILRRFRDRSLEPSLAGRLACAFYYWVSPWLARSLFSHGRAREFMRTILNALCSKLN